MSTQTMLINSLSKTKRSRNCPLLPHLAPPASTEERNAEGGHPGVVGEDTDRLHLALHPMMTRGVGAEVKAGQNEDLGRVPDHLVRHHPRLPHQDREVDQDAAALEEADHGEAGHAGVDLVIVEAADPTAAVDHDLAEVVRTVDVDEEVAVDQGEEVTAVVGVEAVLHQAGLQVRTAVGQEEDPSRSRHQLGARHLLIVMLNVHVVIINHLHQQGKVVRNLLLKMLG